MIDLFLELKGRFIHIVRSIEESIRSLWGWLRAMPRSASGSAASSAKEGDGPDPDGRCPNPRGKPNGVEELAPGAA